MAEKEYNRGLGASAPEGPAGEEAPTREGGQAVRSLGPWRTQEQSESLTAAGQGHSWRFGGLLCAGGPAGTSPRHGHQDPVDPVSVCSVSEYAPSLLDSETSALNSGSGAVLVLLPRAFVAMALELVQGRRGSCKLHLWTPGAACGGGPGGGTARGGRRVSTRS